MASRSQSRPNVLFILSDDQGAWAMGCAGNAELRTPNLDRLAATGTRFTNFFCASPVCSPARATILTGKIPSQHGVHDFLALKQTSIGDGSVDNVEYLADHRSYTEILAGHGYECALSGKWHLGVSSRPQKSFRYWNVFTLGGGPYYNSPMWADGNFYRSPRYISDNVTDNALGFLEKNLENSSPFCMHVHFTAPHSPWNREQHPPELFSEYFDHCEFASVPDVALHHDQLEKTPRPQVPRNAAERREILSGYYAATTAMDANIGRLLDWLEANGLRENTLVFFCSDNGMSMGHHGIWGKGNATFPANMFDTTIKIPAIASQPGRVVAGRIEAAMLSQYDLFPTLLEVCGASHVDATLPGRSFAGILEGGSDRERDRIVVYDEYGPTRMIRTTRWKYIHRYPFGPHALYDLETDAGETTNLAHTPDCAEVVARMRLDLEEWFLRYVVPGKDGVYESVAGRGQTNLAGPAARGKERFPSDLVYMRDL